MDRLKMHSTQCILSPTNTSIALILQLLKLSDAGCILFDSELPMSFFLFFFFCINCSKWIFCWFLCLCSHFDCHSTEFESRTGSLEVPRRKSPTTPQTARQLKTPGSDSDAFSSSPHPASRTPKDRSPKVVERRSPRSPMSEVFHNNS
jgi:hypothetical protein